MTFSPTLESSWIDSRTRSADALQPYARVLHVINGEDYSGAERVQDLLALQLPERGFDVGFACVKPDRFAGVRQAQFAPLVNVPMKSRVDFRPVVRLARYIRRHNCRIVHTHSARSVMLGAPAAALAGVPLVHHVHCQTSTEVRRQWISRTGAVVERLAMRRVAAIVAVSESLRRYLVIRGYPQHKVHLVANGVPGEARLVARPAPSGIWTIGAIAMFRPRKGIEVLLEALSRLRSAGHAVRLRAIGRFQTAEYEREILQLATQLKLEDAIDWVGFRRDVTAELALMDLLVLPSVIAEAMPMSILEAMAVGVPVVGTRVDGITDLVRDGRDGVLAAPGDSEDLARAIGRIVSGELDWLALRSAAHQQQRQHFSDHAMADGVAEVYRHVLAEQNAAAKSAGRAKEVA